MREMRPDLQAAYDLLCYQGEQFAEPHTIENLEDVTFVHPVDGVLSVAADMDALAQQGMIYSSNQRLRDVLSEHDIITEEWTQATDLLVGHLGDEGLVWGFSGYATGGFNRVTNEPFGYQKEAEGLAVLYDHLSKTDQMPSLTVDGGVSEGFLALSAIIAQNLAVPTVGFIPKQGLASVGIRDHLIIAGNTYQDREALVGTADILVCAGGEKGTIRECLSAIRHGSAVLMLALKKYPPNSLPNTYYKYDELWEAEEAGNLVICESLDEIPEGVDKLLSYDTKANNQRRIDAVTSFKP